MKDAEWPALESDPEIFTNYFHSLGAPSDVFFKELLGLEYKEFMSVGGPLLGVVLNYERLKKKEIKPEDTLPTDGVKFYMKQTPKLDNACGLIAGLHILGNSNVKFKEGSFLEEFYKKSEGKKWDEIPELLEKNKKFQEIHSEHAEKGQTHLSGEQVKAHYIGFIYQNNSVIELDGIKNGPYLIKKDVKSEDFLDIVTKEILRRVQEKEIKEQISVLLCANSESNIIDFFAD